MASAMGMVIAMVAVPVPISIQGFFHTALFCWVGKKLSLHRHHVLNLYRVIVREIKCASYYRLLGK